MSVHPPPDAILVHRSSHLVQVKVTNSRVKFGHQAVNRDHKVSWVPKVRTRVQQRIYGNDVRFGFERAHTCLVHHETHAPYNARSHFMRPRFVVVLCIVFVLFLFLFLFLYLIFRILVEAKYLKRRRYNFWALTRKVQIVKKARENLIVEPLYSIRAFFWRAL
ncbi:hypothetical protein CRV24_006327 [Beauveria bassiana]|nr:hypothetical protein CRV24_006327 [Beauveria bassiana]KAH8708672.1 hypothetical protein HC256_008611 [Beauveria bassiana]